jgi:hypothetical protein
MTQLNNITTTVYHIQQPAAADDNAPDFSIGPEISGSG